MVKTYTGDALRDLQLQLWAAEQVRNKRKGPTPPADQLGEHLYGVAAGDNKLGLEICATCGKPPTETGVHNMPLAFLMRDTLSVREYRISGMCQQCQDDTFREPPENEEDRRDPAC